MEMYCVFVIYFLCEVGKVMYIFWVYFLLFIIIFILLGVGRDKRDLIIEYLMCYLVFIRYNIW